MELTLPAIAKEACHPRASTFLPKEASPGCCSSPAPHRLMLPKMKVPWRTPKPPGSSLPLPIAALPRYKGPSLGFCHSLAQNLSHAPSVEREEWPGSRKIPVESMPFSILRLLTPIVSDLLPLLVTYFPRHGTRR